MNVNTNDINQLRKAVDLLWGYMPPKEVQAICQDEPDLFAMCQTIHEELWHAEGCVGG